jgi:glycosidase
LSAYVTNYYTSLATETEYVRSKLAAYANDLIALGVDGLRLDAAKRLHISFAFRIGWLTELADIPTADIANILSRLSSKVYITQEVIFGAGEPITPAMYTGNGEH